MIGGISLTFLAGALISDTTDSLLALALVGVGGICGELLRKWVQPVTDLAPQKP
jgi:hypothetical protein